MKTSPFFAKIMATKNKFRQDLLERSKTIQGAKEIINECEHYTGERVSINDAIAHLSTVYALIE